MKFLPRLESSDLNYFCDQYSCLMASCFTVQKASFKRNQSENKTCFFILLMKHNLDEGLV